jgi:hypothetical protein
MGRIHGFAAGMRDGVRYTVTGGAGAGAGLTDNLGPGGACTTSWWSASARPE